MFTFIEISRRPSRKIFRLFTLPYKRQDKTCKRVSEVQLVLCEDAVHLKRVIVTVYAKGIHRE